MGKDGALVQLCNGVLVCMTASPPVLVLHDCIPPVTCTRTQDPHTD